MSENRSLAATARGPAILVAPIIGVLLVALPVSWFLPLFRTQVAVFFKNEVSVIGAVQSLYDTDLAICAIVVAFGMVIPMAKLAAYLVAWLALPVERSRSWIKFLARISKFSMLDIFLIAVTIVGFKGVGLGKVTVEYGLYVFAGLVIAIVFLSFMIQSQAARAD
jgi:paraquat-inducible protein A